MASEKSAILARLQKRSKTAWEKKKKVETPVLRGQLPNNLSGIGKLVSATFGEENNEDKTPYVSLNHIIVEPEENRGQRYSFRYRFKDTAKKTVEDCHAQFANDLAILGLQTENYELSGWEQMLDDLVAMEIFTKFHTWKGKPTKEFPNPQVNIDFDGVTDYDGDGLPTDAAPEVEADEPQPDEAEAPADEEAAPPVPASKTTRQAPPKAAAKPATKTASPPPKKPAKPAAPPAEPEDEPNLDDEGEAPSLDDEGPTFEPDEARGPEVDDIYGIKGAGGVVKNAQVIKVHKNGNVDVRVLDNGKELKNLATKFLVEPLPD